MSDSVLEKAGSFRGELEPLGWLSRTGSPSPYAECLMPLLASLEWQGEIHQICESLPHYPDQIDRVDFINVMANLQYQIQQVEIRIKDFDQRLMPVLAVKKQGGKKEQPYIIFAGEDGSPMVFDGLSRKTCGLSSLKLSTVSLYTFQPFSEESQQADRITANVDEKPMQWFRRLIQRFMALHRQVFITSLVINLLALMTSLFVMAVYDKVIGSRSQETLIYLGTGIFLAIGFESILRYIRSRGMAFFGVRIDAVISTAIFRKILSLPPRIVENSSIPAQIARLKDFDSVRNFFSGQLGVSLVEFPFTLIFLFAIWFIGGPLVKIPLLLGFFYVLLGAVMLPRLQDCTEKGAAAGVKRQTILVETMRKIRAIRVHGIKSQWLKRYQELSGISAHTSFISSLQTAVVESLAYGLSVMAGITTLTYGIFLVWDAQITTGGLIASMMLVWRVISPLQTICNSLVRIRYVFRSVGQVHKLLRSEGEDTALLTNNPFKLQGDISFSGVGLRYSAEQPAVFSGTTLEINKGDVIAVTGQNGSGKSSFLKLIIGLYPLQMGAIRIDGKDIRQRDPVALRRNIAYVPQTPELFHGSIEQNLRMCKPDATEEEIQDALKQAGALEDVANLEEGVNYFIGDYRSEQLSSDLNYQLTLARAYLRDSTIMLFDEMPRSLSGKSTGDHFRSFLKNERGQKTLVFVTDKEEEILSADKLIYLAGDGQVLMGAPSELLTALKE